MQCIPMLWKVICFFGTAITVRIDGRRYLNDKYHNFELICTRDEWILQYLIHEFYNASVFVRTSTYYTKLSHSSSFLRSCYYLFSSELKFEINSRNTLFQSWFISEYPSLYRSLIGDDRLQSKRLFFYIENFWEFTLFTTKINNWLLPIKNINPVSSLLSTRFIS